MILQAFEYMSLSQKKSVLKIWNFKNLKSDFESGLPLPHKLLQFIFSDKIFYQINFLQLVLAATYLIFPISNFFIVLFLTQLYNCIRFRGNFNGGSDMMTFVVLIGLLISYSSENEKVRKLGLIFISINLFYSYLKAGLVKIIHSEWRSGKALPIFLKRSAFADSKKIANWLSRNLKLSAALCWGVLFFELSFVFILFFNDLAYYYFLFAIFFHFILYLSFGLNRFFWVWLSAWPALLFSIRF
jgi:hypothetical protein